MAIGLRKLPDLDQFADSERTLTRMAFALLVLAVVWRIVRYLLPFPIWGDEAMLAMNFRHDYLDLTRRLDYCQIAPLLFLWGERAVYELLGGGAWALRLLPLLAGLASLGLFWRLTALTLSARARLFAFGFLALANWTVVMSTLVKPYSFDLMWSLLLLVPALEWLRAPQRTLWLFALGVVGLLAPLGSYPSVFVAGGVSLALAYRVWQHGWRARSLFALYNVLLLAGFALSLSIGTAHLDQDGMTTRGGMFSYWAAAFPPDGPLAMLWWFVLSTAGQMTAYPIGSASGGSILTVLCCLAGILWGVRRREWVGLVLCVGPIALNLLAAFLRRYPYGASGRLCQHLAPGICILAGLGLAELVQKARTSTRRASWTLALTCFFFLVGLGGITRELVHPYRDESCRWYPSTMRSICSQIPVAGPVIMCGKPTSMDAVFSWYWLHGGAQLSWEFQIPPDALAGDRIWAFHGGANADGSCRRMLELLDQQDPSWELEKRVTYHYEPRDRNEWALDCALLCFRRTAVATAGPADHPCALPNEKSDP